MTRATRIAAAGALVLLGHLILFAQSQSQSQSQTQSQQPPVFRGRASLVRVDVTVTDRHGEPVTSLAESDFDVTEDGVPQTIETFKLVSADGRQAEDDDTSLEIRSPEHAAAEAARDEVRVFLLFWDEYHIGRFASAIRARQALGDFVSSAFGPTDLVALMDPLLPTDAIRWTRNFGDVAQAVKKLEGRSHVYVPARSVLEEAQLQHRDVERLRSEVTISALKSAASYLGGLREGRKAIIFVSEGLPALYRGDDITLIDDLVRTANDNNTAIYTVDPRGLGPGVPDVLRTLAANTGAEAFVNTNTPARDLRRVITDASAFYLLGYASAKNPADGKFHKIDVRIRRKGFDVHARKGYWAPGAIDTARAAREAAAAPPPEISAALAPLAQGRPERALDLWIGAARDPAGATTMTMAWTPHIRQGSGRTREASVRVIAQSAAGSRTFDAPWTSRRLSFAAEPGDLVLQTFVRDAEGETIDEDTRTVTVPNLASAALALSSPVLILARNASELRQVNADSVPFAGREFSRTDRLFVRFAVCGETAPKAVVSARLLSRAGAELRALVAAPGAAVGSFEIDLPLASIARGDYLIAIEATEGDEHVNALVPFRVVSKF